MLRWLVKLATTVAIIGFAVFWWLTIPQTFDDTVSITYAGDAAKGEAVFWASGCASCHAKKGAKDDEKLRLGGDHPLVTPVGTFYAPNISPHPEFGIGSWSLNDFANAVLLGTSPDGRHYYPAFPYTSYSTMTRQDLADLFEFIKTLEPVATPNKPHDLPFPFNISRSTGLWKLAFPHQRPNVDTGGDAELERGRYLVEVLGHCGECHTPRTNSGLGGMDTSRWLSGGPAPEGDSKIPNITPHEDGLASWSQSDIAYYLESGFTPDFDSVGGTMVSVQQNMSKLPKSDLNAMAKYLKSIPPVASHKTP